MSRKSEAAKREVRRKQVAANLLAGLTYRQMAGALGVGIGTIARDVKIIMGRWAREHVESVKQLMEARFDRALNAIWDDVRDGNIAAINTMLKIEEQRAKLGGLNAPVKADVTSGGERIKGYCIVSPDDWPSHGGDDD